MTVEAVYIGPRQNGNYWVNVRNANPKGNYGDAGVVHRFNSEAEAKAYVQTVNNENIRAKRTSYDELQDILKRYPANKPQGTATLYDFVCPYELQINANDDIFTKIEKSLTNMTRLQKTDGLSGFELLKAHMKNMYAYRINPFAQAEVLSKILQGKIVI